MEGVIASRNYYPGDVIYKEQAFAKVVPRNQKDIMCEYCCKTSMPLKACKNCLAAKYCGKECQKNDWSCHKLECKHLKNLTKSPGRDFVRLLGKIILKIKGKDWKLIKSSVFGKEFSFDDVDSHYKEMVENPRLILFFNEIKELTGNYIGFENLPDDDSLNKIIGKVRFGSLALGFFIGLAMFELECIPNSNVTVYGNGIKIWAFKKIRKGQNKITLSRQTVIIPAVRFEDGGLNPCKCADCSLPYGESVLFKILDKKRAFTIICETEGFLNAAEGYNNILSYPEFQQVVNHLLRKQEGVLGDTNHLRMALLALRCLNIRGDPWETKRLLLILEKSMRTAFGEHYLEMLPIYKALCAINFELGYPSAMIEYLKKALLIEQHLV